MEEEMSRDEYFAWAYDALEELASREYQRQYWFTENPSDGFSTPEEAIHRGFEDLSMMEQLESPELSFSDDQKVATRRLDRVLDEFCESHPRPWCRENVFDDPKWEEVRIAAQALRDLFAPWRDVKRSG